PQRVRARFRAYDSVEASLADYARLIHQSPRYAEVRSQTGSAQAWAQGLQRAGYATDPQYAAKLSRVIEMAQQRMA
ncbi:MAG: flagellar assembly peptidoglycan hydrolase FlgJ, partial [Betaproteobacteria bacterium]|nr:flagellar assembly peptidoglycan hydrolase FlgJ [Betaproteobacteria bacterium]